MMLWSLIIISATAGCMRLNGNTSQSSTYFSQDEGSFKPDRAIDGNESSCAHTDDNDPNPWWTIDLLGVYNISSVWIYNTNADNTDITGAQIHIGSSRANNGTDNSICQNITDFRKAEWNEFKCQWSMLGRYITVSFQTEQTEQKFTIVCEMEINGTKLESPFDLISKMRTWENALSYCRERNRDLASILNPEDQAWAELHALNASTPYIWLGLHYTCTLDLWFWVEDYRVDFSQWAPKNGTGQCDMSGAMETRKEHLWYKVSDHNEFHFICTK